MASFAHSLKTAIYVIAVTAPVVSLAGDVASVNKVVKFVPVRTHLEFVTLSRPSQQIYLEAIQKAAQDVARESARQGNSSEAQGPSVCEVISRRSECNPVLFGPGQSCSRTGDARAFCERNKAPDKALEYARENPDRWNDLKSDMDSYCEKGDQPELCMVAQRRLIDIEPSISSDLPKTNTVEVANGVPVSPQTAEPVERETYIGKHARVVGTTRGLTGLLYTKVETPNIRRFIDPAAVHIGSCNTAALLKDVRTSHQPGEILVPYQRARDLICNRRPLSKEELKAFKERVEHDNEVIRSSNLLNKKEIYAWNNSILRNYEACNKEAQSSSKVIEFDSSKAGLRIEWTVPGNYSARRIGPGVDRTPFGASISSMATDLLANGVTLCNTIASDSAEGSSPSRRTRSNGTVR
ncbi:MAG TPA: hypothetical protein VM432_14670 [Bdellovibrionales bacterium]|nr:hypothetical protein [Bdellovibrionales bacterium]